MTGIRRRRGDFVRATLGVLVDLPSHDALSPASGERLCGIAAGACGAARVELYALRAFGQDDQSLTCVARSSLGEGASRQDDVTPDLLRRALAHGGLLGRSHLLIGALVPIEEGRLIEPQPGATIGFWCCAPR